MYCAKLSYVYKLILLNCPFCFLRFEHTYVYTYSINGLVNLHDSARLLHRKVNTLILLNQKSVSNEGSGPVEMSILKDNLG